MCQLKPENIYFLGQCILVNWYISRCFISSKQRPSMLVIPIQINRSIIWPHFNWCGSRIGKQQGKCYIAAFTWIYGFMAHNLLSKTKVKYYIFLPLPLFIPSCLTSWKINTLFNTRLLPWVMTFKWKIGGIFMTSLQKIEKWRLFFWQNFSSFD